MILFFSGTGNSEYAAKRIGRETEDDVSNLFKKIRNQDYTALRSDKPWIIVTPTYAWRIPRVVTDWLLKTKLEGSRDIRFVMTCGGNIGNAGAYLEKLCEKKGMTYQGCASVLMPENYIALFETPSREEALVTIGQAEQKIEEIIQWIKAGTSFPKPEITGKDKHSSGVVNNVFYPLFVHAGKFYATDACISCGMCEKSCPLGNIRLKDGKPVWGKACTHCMACICRCPQEAIEYGKHSVGLPRYVCPKRL